jgi:PIN domain nuclease of toxin-antitoxin system
VEAVIYLDTHVVVWLYARELSRFTGAGLASMEANELFISPMVALELEYLRETGRIQTGSRTICDSLVHAVGLRVCERPFADVVRLAIEQNWTRDPFDRMIVAQANAAGAQLLTKDSMIRKQYSKAFWD